MIRYYLPLSAIGNVIDRTIIPTTIKGNDQQSTQQIHEQQHDLHLLEVELLKYGNPLLSGIGCATGRSFGISGGFVV